jgi:hypothetical protein
VTGFGGGKASMNVLANSSQVSNSGDRFNIKTADHADLPPPDEQTGERPPWFIAYTECSIPRYLAVVNIAGLGHNQP